MSSANNYDAVYVSPLGPIGVKMEGDSITAIDWLSPRARKRKASNKNVARLIKALDAYFTTGKDLPDYSLEMTGTAFQKKVWNALQKIPSGKVLTYGDLAKKLKTGSRAIGMGCRTNPVALLVPCHRVVAANGLGGYMGDKQRTEIKAWLLRHEGVYL